MRKIAFNVMGKPWTLRLLSKSEFKKRHGSDGALAISNDLRKYIDLSPYGVDLETINHELVHAYVHELCLTSTNDLQFSDVEEIFAELISKRGEELLSLGKELSTKVNSIINSKKLKKEG